jgi:hypothetical protein
LVLFLFTCYFHNENKFIGSPLRCDVNDGSSNKTTATARGEGLNSVVLGSTAYFEVNPHTSDSTNIDATVSGEHDKGFRNFQGNQNRDTKFVLIKIITTYFSGPDNNRVPCSVEKLETGLYRCHYQPVTVGTHFVTITQRMQSITKQPFTVQVFDPMAVKVYDISDAICGSPATLKGYFTADHIR